MGKYKSMGPSSAMSPIAFPNKIVFQQQFCVSWLLKHANFWTHELVRCLVTLHSVRTIEIKHPRGAKPC